MSDPKWCAQSYELVGGPLDGGMVALPAGVYPEWRIAASVTPSSWLFEPDPAAKVDYVEGVYRAESADDVARRVLRWQGYR